MGSVEDCMPIGIWGSGMGIVKGGDSGGEVGLEGGVKAGGLASGLSPSLIGRILCTGGSGKSQGRGTYVTPLIWILSKYV